MKKVFHPKTKKLTKSLENKGMYSINIGGHSFFLKFNYIIKNININIERCK